MTIFQHEHVRAYAFYILCGLFFFLVTATKLVLAAEDTFTLIGSRNCAIWLEERAKEAMDPNGVRSIGSAGSRSWLLGFLSGYNAASAGKDVLGAIDPDTIYVWMDRYCKQHPQSSQHSGGIELILELKKIAK